MMRLKLNDLKPFLEESAVILGNTDFCVTNIQSAENINSESLDWVNPLKKDKVGYINDSLAHIILCGHGVNTDLIDLTSKCLIIVENPKLTFIRIADHFFYRHELQGIHTTAVIHPEAIISDTCYIGPNSYVGKCKIGKNTVIYGNCYLYDETSIGENVVIHAGTVIGADGFGYLRNQAGELERFPHIGGVVIGNNVDIGSNTSIDRGALGNTIIEEGAKIDNLVHIAHNVKVGKHSAVIAHAMVGGSTIIGDYSWVAPSVALRDRIKIGSKTTVGMGAVVTKKIPDDETWTGSPAKELNEFLSMQRKIKNL